MKFNNKYIQNISKILILIEYLKITLCIGLYERLIYSKILICLLLVEVSQKD